MAGSEKLRDRDEIARTGADLIDRCIVPSLPAGMPDKFIAVDVNSGEQEIGDDECAVARRLHARLPGAEVWLGGTGALSEVKAGLAPNLRGLIGSIRVTAR